MRHIGCAICTRQRGVVAARRTCISDMPGADEAEVTKYNPVKPHKCHCMPICKVFSSVALSNILNEILICISTVEAVIFAVICLGISQSNSAILPPSAPDRLVLDVVSLYRRNFFHLLRATPYISSSLEMVMLNYVNLILCLCLLIFLPKHWISFIPVSHGLSADTIQY